MSDQHKIGMINAVIDASEYVINHNKSDKGLIIMAKETAYDQIKEIMSGKIPWQEDKE